VKEYHAGSSSVLLRRIVHIFRHTNIRVHTRFMYIAWATMVLPYTTANDLTSFKRFEHPIWYRCIRIKTAFLMALEAEDAVSKPAPLSVEDPPTQSGVKHPPQRQDSGEFAPSYSYGCSDSFLVLDVSSDSACARPRKYLGNNYSRIASPSLHQ